MSGQLLQIVAYIQASVTTLKYGPRADLWMLTGSHPQPSRSAYALREGALGENLIYLAFFFGGIFVAAGAPASRASRSALRRS